MNRTENKKIYFTSSLQLSRRGHSLGIRLLDLFFPPRCPLCDKPTSPREQRIHAACRSRLTAAAPCVCMKCGRPIHSDRIEYCPQCNLYLPSFTQGKSLFVYSGPIKQTMYRFKYSNRREYAIFFAREAFREHRSWLQRISPDCIIPVPMHPGKRRARGYNQAEDFARELSFLLSCPLKTDLVLRKHNTKALKNFNADMRRKELSKAFEAAGEASRYHTVLLVDDIYTTGSTADAITKLLLKQGVDRVYVLTVCIAVGW